MKLAASNIALKSYDHLDDFHRLAAMGLTGLEVSPSRAREDWWHGLKPSAVDAYRTAAESAGLRVVGLHTLFWQQPDLGLFRATDARAQTLDYLTHMSRLCADLGGRSLVFGSGRARMRGALSLDDAIAETIRFFRELAPRIEGHGTCFAFEALGKQDSDFLNSVTETLRVVDGLDSPVMKTHLDAKAMVQAGEVNADCFVRARSTAVHFHANEPDLGVLSRDGEVDHAALGDLLRGISYDGFVSLEQRMVNEDDPLSDLARSTAVLKECYG